MLRIVPELAAGGAVGAAGGAAAGAATGAAAGGVTGAGALCARSGMPQPPSIVPTRSMRVARLETRLLLEITRPRLKCGAAPLRSARFDPFSLAPIVLANQAPQAIE